MIVPSKLVCMTSISSARSVLIRLLIDVIPTPKLGKRKADVSLGVPAALMRISMCRSL